LKNEYQQNNFAELNDLVRARLVAANGGGKFDRAQIGRDMPKMGACCLLGWSCRA
jgi:hypothetical protein